MTSLPEQMAAARKWQLESQLDFFKALTSQVFTRTEQVIALNLDTSRAAVERSSNAVRQLFAITDPRDLVTLGSQGRAQFEQMLAYSRELFSIASGAQAPAAVQAPMAAPAPAAAQARATPPAPMAAQVEATAWTPPAPQAAQAAAERVGNELPTLPEATQAAPAPEPAAAETGHFAGGVKPSKKPLVATFPEADSDVAKAKPIAKAASQLAPHHGESQHPLSSPVAPASGPVEMPPIAPVEAAPPPAPVSGTPEIEVKQAQRTGGKNPRRK